MGVSKSSKSYLSYQQRTTFNLYAELISDYTRRVLTFQSDAAKDFKRVLAWLDRDHQAQVIHGLLETELDAALLWSPTGSCIRRWDKHSAAFLFPSWSWLGWIGHAAYPWSIEREYFMSTVHSPLIWQDANSLQPTPVWFTSEDLCLPRSKTRGRVLADLRKGKGDDRGEDHLGLRRACNALCGNLDSSSSQYPGVRWPASRKPTMKYAVEGSHRLCFRTLSKSFSVADGVYQRKENYNVEHKIFRLSVLDHQHNLGGYIDIPVSPGGKEPFLGLHEFVALSRSTIGTWEPAPDPLKMGHRPNLYSQKGMGTHGESTSHSSSYINEKGNFDTRAYDEKRPWCLFNVMMIEFKGRVAYRLAIGRIHVDAFLFADSVRKEISLE